MTLTHTDLLTLARMPRHDDVNWPAAYIRLSEQLEAATARIAELEAAASPMAVCIAAAAELAELTGQSCHVEGSAWFHPDHYGPKVNAEWIAYRSGQIHASFTGKTLEEAVAKVRADWAKVNGPAEVAARQAAYDGTPDDTVDMVALAGPTPTAETVQESLDMLAKELPY